jgi:hypothetical protein
MDFTLLWALLDRVGWASERQNKRLPVVIFGY